MVKLRQIKKYGGTFVIKLSPTDIIDYGIKKNDKVDIEDILIKHYSRGGATKS